MSQLRPSVQPTFDSRETGPVYWVTTEVGSRTVAFRSPVPDPFVRTTVRLSLWDLLRGLLRGRLAVTVTVGGDVQRMNDVLELDANVLVPGRRRASEFRVEIADALRRFGREFANDGWEEVSG